MVIDITTRLQIVDMAEFTMNNISICSNFEVESADEILRYIDSASNISPPNGLKNLYLNFDQDEPLKSELRWGPNGEGEPVPESGEVMFLNALDESNEGHLHMNANSENDDEFIELFQKILKLIGEVEVNVMVFNLDIDKGYNDLNIEKNLALPEEASGELFQISGIRFDINDPDHDFLLQKGAQEEQTKMQYRVGDITVNTESSETFIESELQFAEDLIETL